MSRRSIHTPAAAQKKDLPSSQTSINAPIITRRVTNISSPSSQLLQLQSQTASAVLRPTIPHTQPISTATPLKRPQPSRKHKDNSIEPLSFSSQPPNSLVLESVKKPQQASNSRTQQLPSGSTHQITASPIKSTTTSTIASRIPSSQISSQTIHSHIHGDLLSTHNTNSQIPFSLNFDSQPHSTQFDQSNDFNNDNDNQNYDQSEHTNSPTRKGSQAKDKIEHKHVNINSPPKRTTNRASRSKTASDVSDNDEDDDEEEKDEDVISKKVTKKTPVTKPTAKATKLTQIVTTATSKATRMRRGAQTEISLEEKQKNISDEDENEEASTRLPVQRVIRGRKSTNIQETEEIAKDDPHSSAKVETEEITKDGPKLLKKVGDKAEKIKIPTQSAPSTTKKLIRGRTTPIPFPFLSKDSIIDHENVNDENNQKLMKTVAKLPPVRGAKSTVTTTITTTLDADDNDMLLNNAIDDDDDDNEEEDDLDDIFLQVKPTRRRIRQNKPLVSNHDIDTTTASISTSGPGIISNQTSLNDDDYDEDNQPRLIFLNDDGTAIEGDIAHYKYDMSMPLFELLQTKRKKQKRFGDDNNLSNDASLSSFHNDDDINTSNASMNNDGESSLLGSYSLRAPALVPHISTQTDVHLNDANANDHDDDDDDDIFGTMALAKRKSASISYLLDDDDDAGLFSDDESAAFQSNPKPATNQQNVGPKMKIVDGNIVLDDATLFVHHQVEQLTFRDTSNIKITSRSFRRIKEHEKPIHAAWTLEEIRLLHNLLATPVIGHNSLLLLPYFPGKSLKQIKNRLKSENLTHGARLDTLLVKNKQVKFGSFQSRINSMPLVDAVHLDEIRKQRAAQEEQQILLLAQVRGEQTDHTDNALTHDGNESDINTNFGGFLQHNSNSLDAPDLDTMQIPMLLPQMHVKSAGFLGFDDDDENIFQMSISGANKITTATTTNFGSNDIANNTHIYQGYDIMTDEGDHSTTQGGYSTQASQSASHTKVEHSVDPLSTSARRSRTPAPKLAIPPRRR